MAQGSRLVAQVGSERPLVMAGGGAVTAWPSQLGFRRNAGEAKPSRACGSLGGGEGGAWGRRLATGVSGAASSPTALMAGGGGLQRGLGHA
jgi:hypothetical protein